MCNIQASKVKFIRKQSFHRAKKDPRKFGHVCGDEWLPKFTCPHSFESVFCDTVLTLNPIHPLVINPIGLIHLIGRK